MENFWRTLGTKLGERWKLAVGVLLLITIVLGFGLTRLEFATGQDSYLNPDSQIALDNVEFQDTFGGEAVVVMFSAQGDARITDLFQGDNLAELRRLNAELQSLDGVFGVVLPVTSLTYSSNLLNGAGQTALLTAPARDEAGTEVRSADVTMSLARLSQTPQDERVFGLAPDATVPSGQWVEMLLFDNTGYTQNDAGEIVPPAPDDRRIRLSLQGSFPDQQTAVGGVVLGGNLSLDEQTLATNEVLEVFETAEFEGFDLTVTGSPVYLKEINDYLKGGMLLLGAIALVVMALVLTVLFNVKWRLLPLLAVIVGIAWAFSLVGLIGMDLSLVTIAGLPILIGLGIDFAIQIHNRVDEESYLDREEHPVSETLPNLAPPLIAATLAGVVSFLALRLSRVPMIRDFGLMLAIGVIVLVAAGILVPATLLGLRKWSNSDRPRKESIVEKIVVKLGGLSSKAGFILVIASIGLFAAGVAVEGRTKIQSDPVEWIDQDSEVVADIDRLEAETGFSSTMGVIVKANNVFDQDIIDLVHEFTLDAEERPLVVTTSSFVSTMAKIIQIDGATAIAPTEKDIVDAAAGAAEVAPDIHRALVNGDQTAIQINMRVGPSTLEERAVLVDELKADLDARIDELSANLDADSILLDGLDEGEAAVSATPAGLATVGIGLLENLSANRAALTYFALGLAGLFLVLRFRSLSRALLALVPVFLAVGASSLIVGLIGIQLSPLTTVSGPLVVATCTEFSVLILGRYLEERQNGLATRDASDRAAARTGRAFFTSAATTIGGFGVLIISPLPLLRDFGIIVTLNVAIALLAALILMPPMMMWVDNKQLLGTRRQVDDGAAVRLAADFDGGQAIAAGAGVLAFAGCTGGVFATAERESGSAVYHEYAAVPLPTTTTTTTTTQPVATTQPPPATTAAPTEPGDSTPAATEAPGTTVPAGPKVDPSGFGTERPATPIAQVLFDLVTAQGTAPNVANCAIETAYGVADEQTLIEMGIATPTVEALDIVAQGALDCGMTPDEIMVAVHAQFPDAEAPPSIVAARDAAARPAGTTAPATTQPAGTEAPGTTVPAGPKVDPSGFGSERPATPIAGVLFDLVTAQGTPANVANCAIETAYGVADEQTLIEMGIATPTVEALDIVAQGALDCGMTPDEIMVAVHAQFPDAEAPPSIVAARN